MNIIIINVWKISTLDYYSCITLFWYPMKICIISWLDNSIRAAEAIGRRTTLPLFHVPFYMSRKLILSLRRMFVVLRMLAIIKSFVRRSDYHISLPHVQNCLKFINFAFSEQVVHCLGYSHHLQRLITVLWKAIIALIQHYF